MTPDYSISLAGQRFDPREESAGAVEPSRSRKRPAADWHIVQFDHPLTRAERDRIRGHGLKLAEYVPNLAYLERLTARQLATVADDPAFRAAMPMHPKLKLSPGIGELVHRTDKRRRAKGLQLMATLFADANPKTAAGNLRKAGATDVKVLDDRRRGGQAKVRFVVKSRAAAEALAELPQVRWIEEMAEVLNDNGTTAGTMQSGTPGNETVWDQGLHGEGQIVGMMDTPADFNHCWFQDTANNTPNPAHRKVVGYRDTESGAPERHGTYVAGIVAGDDVNNPGGDANRGNAWAARLTFGHNDDVSDGDVSMLEYLTAAAGDGAAIHTNSWHQEPTPQYNQVAADVDTFVWNNEDHFVCGSSGNAGESIGPPGTAKNALCVSAAQRSPNQMNFGDGNNGPTADDRGRRKPEIFAPGCNIQSAQWNTPCTVFSRNNCATSWATPAVAAAAALARQYYTEGFYPTGAAEPHHSFTPSGALLKATLLNSTIDMTGIAGYPGNQEGWGLIRLDNTLVFPGSARDLRVWDTRNADGLFTGDSRDHHVDVASNAQQLRVTLVWSDPPAAAGATDPVVNDLDLTVTSPDGTQVFLGNVFGAGAQSMTGGTPDSVNNVEMVVVNQPAPGDWTITVSATAVNVGNPGQGYAVVATADLTDPPSPIGNQDTLVVRVKFADVGVEPSLPNLTNLMTEVATYFDEVSYGQTTVSPIFRGPIELDHPKSYYYHPSRNLLIELTEEVVAKLVAAEPDVFDRGPGAEDDVDRMVIVTNDVNFDDDWATTGPWPYEMPGGLTRPISVSIQSYANPSARFTHGMAHQFGLVDLYAHEGVTFPRPYVDEWDNMASFTGVHPLAWSKERAGWITAHGAEVLYVPRPAAGATFSDLIPLFLQAEQGQNRKAIAIGLTEGAATLADERVFYWIEARDNTLGGFDDGLPSSGVLVYYVNESIPQGQGPVILRDRDLTSSTLSDAAFDVGDGQSIPGTGITFAVQSGTAGAAYRIQLDYDPPETDYNVFITKGDTIGGEFYPWFSPDIWVDSPKNGYDLGGGPPPHDQRDEPVVNMVNRLYARVHNAGPGTAFDFDVRFRISEPYHTVGGEADFDQFVGIRHIDSLPPGQTDVFVEWTPTGTSDPHSCLLVDLINLVGNDTNPNDNAAQENLHEVDSITSSPFHPVTYRYDLTNPFDEPALFYFRARRPRRWKVDLNPRKILLGPGERITGEATITPPTTERVCRRRRIEVTSWTPRGDTLVEVGGAVVQVNLVRPAALTLETDTGRCDDKDVERLIHEAKKAGREVDPAQLRKDCRHITAKGCTDPPLRNQEIVVKFVDPAGNAVYQTVVTDENGCFEAMLVTAEEGNWQVTAEYPGDKCHAGTTAGPRTVCLCR